MATSMTAADFSISFTMRRSGRSPLFMPGTHWFTRTVVPSRGTRAFTRRSSTALCRRVAAVRCVLQWLRMCGSVSSCPHLRHRLSPLPKRRAPLSSTQSSHARCMNLHSAKRVKFPLRRKWLGGVAAL
jgi:hypothetical protein